MPKNGCRVQTRFPGGVKSFRVQRRDNKPENQKSGVDKGPSSQRKAKVGAGSRAGVRPRQQSVDKYFRVSQRVSKSKERTRGRKFKSLD